MVYGVMTVVLFLFLFWRIPASKKETNVKSNQIISIIIPARNEEQTIARLLTSIQSQDYQPLEIIVVNDQSTDRTKDIALQYGARVIDNKDLPAGWLGKSWACWNGATVAKGDILIFVDADTWFSKNGIENAISTFQEDNKTDLLTIHPFHVMERWYEKLSAFFHLVVFLSLGITHIFSKNTKPAGGFGQLLICKKEIYVTLGGHEAIKEQIVENFAFCQLAISKGFYARAIVGKNIINMRMYQDGIVSVFKGWAKSIASGAKKTSPKFTFLIIIWIAVAFSFITKSIDIIFEQSIFFVVTYVFMCLLYFRILRQIGNFSLFDTILFPIHIVFFIFVSCYSVISTFLLKNASWKGRQIVVSKTKGDQDI
ncbi:glycosyltransferase family 2 protein [Bacillus salinus]|uniref:glycosyltransferase n=1 Tax=Bacillus sp. HMF5848 TaxID=2495421 RepID=UPI001639964D|nr:glycosyltransferase [Bacillus sp. HMF5848]